jgi:XTP/dITP diphosphohydrolase/tetrapyrrole methylase family protein/MazG family protein/ATP diphosphatase
MSPARGDERLPQALLELDAITRRLRRECPWDREQDARSIVPHTVEEAYELADAAHAGDDAKLLDELGDVLFQVYFLALLLEERGRGDLADVAAATRAKLVRRHPHIFGEDGLAELPTDATTPAEVKANWDAIKLREGGGGEVAGTLPALTYARKRLRRAEGPQRDPRAALERVARIRELEPPGSHHGSPELYEAVGALLLAVVELAGELGVDPEIALRRAVPA